MPKEIKLNAAVRTKNNGRAKEIRQDGFIPAVLYGSGAASQNLKIKNLDFERVYEIAGESSLIDLVIDKENPIKVIVKDVQIEPVKDKQIHVDFYQVDMSKKITTEIPLNFVGESRAVKELSAMLTKNFDSVEVECLPGDLVSQIDVNIESLENFNDAIRMENLKLPAGIKLTSDTNDMVVSVVEPREAEEEEAEEEKPAEGEEGEEGDLPAQAGEGAKDEAKEDADKKGDTRLPKPGTGGQEAGDLPARAGGKEGKQAGDDKNKK